MRDGLSKIQVKRAHSPYYYGANTAWMSEIIDVQGYDSLTFLMAIGTVVDADATFVVLMQESDSPTFATANDVADSDMVSQTRGTQAETAAAFQFDDDDEVRAIGYIGTKRYVRLYVTPANNTGYANVGIMAILDRPNPANAPITHGAS